jgi:hypothetical protein
MVPPLALLAGFAVVYLWDRWARRLRDAPRWSTIGILVVLAAVVFAVNVRQFWFETPGEFHHTQEAMTIGAMQSEFCGDDVTEAAVVGRHMDALLKLALASYHGEGTQFHLIDYSELQPGRAPDLRQARCVVFSYPFEAQAEQALRDLRREHQNGRVVDFVSPSRKASVKIFVPAAG